MNKMISRFIIFCILIVGTNIHNALASSLPSEVMSGCSFTLENGYLNIPLSQEVPNNIDISKIIYKEGGKEYKLSSGYTLNTTPTGAIPEGQYRIYGGRSLAIQLSELDHDNINKEIEKYRKATIAFQQGWKNGGTAFEVYVQKQFTVKVTVENGAMVPVLACDAQRTGEKRCTTCFTTLEEKKAEESQTITIKYNEVNGYQESVVLFYSKPIALSEDGNLLNANQAKQYKVKITPEIIEKGIIIPKDANWTNVKDIQGEVYE